RYPYLNFNTSYGFNGINNSNTSNTTTLGLSYGLTLGIKIYDGANQRRLEKNARILQENRELEYKRQEQQIMADLNILYSSYQNYIKLLQLEKYNTELAEQKVVLAMEQYRLGQITSLEIREFQRTLLDAQDRLVSALYQAKYAEIYIMQLCGMTHLYFAAD
ncbi:MAG: TolC family protein, partial [Prevotellaceae bacterium]|nr:TolC family protein [Prevotellaceae bacterium]